MNIDKDTQVLIQTIAAKAALDAVERSRQDSEARLGNQLRAEALPLRDSCEQQSSIANEFDNVAKSLYVLEEELKGLAEKLSPVLRNDVDKQLGLATTINDKAAPLLSGLAERHTHILNITASVRSLSSRLQINN